MKKDELSHDISALLALKRNELPSDIYFDGVLPEFHRRQRAALLQPRNSVAHAWNNLLESITALMPVVSIARYASAAALVVLIGTLGAVEMQKSAPATSPEVAAVAPTTATPPATLYAFSQALDSRYLSKMDQSIDAASVGSVNAGARAPHYVLAEMPAASCDATMAF